MDHDDDNNDDNDDNDDDNIWVDNRFHKVNIYPDVWIVFIMNPKWQAIFSP